MFSITYFPPYTGEARLQYFHTRQDAERMIAFYASCGTRSYLN